MDPAPYPPSSLPAPVVTTAADTIPTFTITSTTAYISRLSVPVPPTPAEKAQCCLTLEQKFDALFPRDQIIMLDVLGLSSIGTLQILRDRFARFEIIRKYGPGAAEWNEEVDRLKVPFTTAAFHIIPRSNGSFRLVHRDRILTTGPTVEQYQDPRIPSLIGSNCNLGLTEEKSDLSAPRVAGQRPSTPAASSSPVIPPRLSAALPPPLIPLPSSPPDPKVVLTGPPVVPTSVSPIEASLPPPTTTSFTLNTSHNPHPVDGCQSPPAAEVNTTEYTPAETSSRTSRSSPPCRQSTLPQAAPVPVKPPPVSAPLSSPPCTQSSHESGSDESLSPLILRANVNRDIRSAGPSGREDEVNHKSKMDDCFLSGVTYEDVYNFLDRIDGGLVNNPPPREPKDNPVVPTQPQVLPWRDKYLALTSLKIPRSPLWEYPLCTPKFPALPRSPVPSSFSLGFPLSCIECGARVTPEGEKYQGHMHARISRLMTLAFLFAVGQ